MKSKTFVLIHKTLLSLVYSPMIAYSIFFVGCFFLFLMGVLFNGCQPYRWVAIVSWLNYLILAFYLWGSSAKHLVKFDVEQTFNSSALLHIHHAASHGLERVKKRDFFQAVDMLVGFGYTIPTLTKKNLDGNYTRMFRAILKNIGKTNPTIQQVYGFLPPISRAIQVRRTKHAEHCWRSKDELVSDVFLWTPTDGRASIRRPTRTYIWEFCVDKGYNLEDLPRSKNGKGERERERESGKYAVSMWLDDDDIFKFVYIYLSTNETQNTSLVKRHFHR